MLRRGECRKLVSGLEPQFESFNCKWNKAFPSTEGGNSFLELGKKDQITYLLDCLPSRQPFFGYQPLLEADNHPSLTTTFSLLATRSSNEPDHGKGPLHLHCILGKLVLQRVGKTSYNTPFIVTKGFGESKRDWRFWIWWKHDIKIPPHDRKGLLLKQFISCIRLGNIGANQSLPIEAQYVQGFVSGTPKLADPSTRISITLEDMENLPSETPKLCSISDAIVKLESMSERPTDDNIKDTDQWFRSSRLAGVKDFEVELNGTISSIRMRWKTTSATNIRAIDREDHKTTINKPLYHKLPPMNTIWTLTTIGAAWLVMHVGEVSIKCKEKHGECDLGHLVWSLDLKSFLVLCKHSPEGELYPARERVCEIQVTESMNIKYSVLKLEISVGEVNRARLEILTDQGYQITYADRKGDRELGKRVPPKRVWEEKA